MKDETKSLFTDKDELKARLIANLSDKIKSSKEKDLLSDAVDWLADPDLLIRAVKEFQKIVVGEHCALKTIFLVMAGGSLTLNALATSGNLCVNSSSGTGKDYVVSAVAKAFKKDERVFPRTKITPQAFTYWKQEEMKKGFTWNGKIIYLEDCPTRFLNCDTFKTMSSGGSSATVVKDQVARDIPIVGKPIIVLTTATGEPNMELLRRFPLIYLDESDEQTKNIIKRQAKEATHLKKPSYDPAFLLALELLVPRKVKIPFSEVIGCFFVKYKARMFRTHFARILDYIKFSAVLHQYQRETLKDGHIVASETDWDLVRNSIELITQSKQGFNFNHNENKLLKLLTVDSWQTNSELRMKRAPYSEKGLNDALGKLLKLGIINMQYRVVEKGRSPKEFCLVSEEEAQKIPTMAELIQNASDTSARLGTSESSGTSESIVTEVSEVTEVKIQGTKKVSIRDLVEANIASKGIATVDDIEKMYGEDFDEALAWALTQGEVFQPRPNELEVSR